MNRDQWRDLQRSLCPADLETVQRFAEKLALDHPFVFVHDGRWSISLDGPGILSLSQHLLAALAEGGPPDLAAAVAPSPSAMQ